MKEFRGLAAADVRPNETWPYGALLIVASGGDRPDPLGADDSTPDEVWVGTLAEADDFGWSALGQPPGGTRPGRPAVARDGGGLLEILVTGQDGAVWHAREVSSAVGPGWSAWQSLGQPDGVPPVTLPIRLQKPDPAPVAVSNADGCLDVFVVRQDYAVWHVRQTQPGGPWSGWESLGRPGGQIGGTTGPVVAVANADGRLELFTTDTNERVQRCWQRQAGGDWSAWESLEHPTGVPAGSKLAAVQISDGRLELFMVGTDGAVWHRWQNHVAAEGPGGWSGWVSLGRPAVGGADRQLDDLTVARDRSGGLVLFATEPDVTPPVPGSVPRMWMRCQFKPGDAWVGWLKYPFRPQTSGPLAVRGPVLATRGQQLILLLREAVTQRIYVVSQSTTNLAQITGWPYQRLPFQSA